MNRIHAEADPSPREHGGNLGDAIRRFGGAPSDWLDLSTGINPVAWPLPRLPAELWTRLPDRDAMRRLEGAARAAWAVPDAAVIVVAPGASALIRLMPRLAQPAKVAIPGPTYNEHAAAFADEGWDVTEQPGPGVTAAAIVNPNNPDGRRWSSAELMLLAEALDLLVVDESFMDPTPALSLIPECGADNLVVLRSFGKFYGLAGLRLGFAVTGPVTAARVRDLLGPWPVSGPALQIGAHALSDYGWSARTIARLAGDADRLRDLAVRAGWVSVGGTALFQTFETGDGAAAQARLAEHRIWSRAFAYAPGWLRLGLPGGEAAWDRLERALG